MLGVLPRILVVGASPDATNPNAPIRNLVARAFMEICSCESVKTATFQEAVGATSEFHPHLVLVFGSCAPSVCDFSLLRHTATSTASHLAFWVHEDPYEFDHHTKFSHLADTIFTNDLGTITHYNRNRVFHLPLAGCKRMHYRKLRSSDKKARDIYFCGVAFPNRLQLFRELDSVFLDYRTRICGPGWPNDRSHIYHNQRVPYCELSDHYNTSNVVLNVGRDFSLANRLGLVATSPAPRTFEAAMAGVVQLYLATNEEICNYFVADSEIVLFRNSREAEEKLRFLLANPDVCFKIALLSQQRALQDHSYAKRIENIIRYCLPEFVLELKA